MRNPTISLFSTLSEAFSVPYRAIPAQPGGRGELALICLARRGAIAGSGASLLYDPVQALYGFIVRLLSGEHEAKRDEREVGRPSSQQLHTLVKRACLTASGAFSQQLCHQFGLSRPAFEKVAVQGIELHGMHFGVLRLLLSLLALPAVLSHMRAVDGGLFHAHVVSESSHVEDGATVMLRTDVEGLRFIVDQCNADVCLGTYFDGERLYSVNINGTVLPVSGEPDPYLRALRILGTLDFLSPGFTANGGEIYDGGVTQFDGKTVRRIYVSDTIATPMVIFIDPKTWLVAGARDIGRRSVYQMRDYRRVGPYLLPFEIDRNGEPIERYVSRELAPGNLQIPKGVAPLHMQPPAEMALDSGSISPAGTCTIAGVSARCLIDSGNSAMSMSLELAEQLGLKPVGMLHISGLGAYATEVVRAGPLQMGDVEFPEMNYIVLSDVHRYGYDLVIGADVLASMPITIDSAAHEVYFDTDPAGAAAANVTLSFENFIPVVTASLDGEPTQLAIDTGDQSNINLAYDYYEQHPQIFQATKSVNVSGVGGDSVELMGEIARVRIGGILAENQPIGTTKTLKGTADGHIGAGFLSQYRVVFDYAHALMRLLPLKAP